MPLDLAGAVGGVGLTFNDIVGMHDRIAVTFAWVSPVQVVHLAPPGDCE